MANWESLPHDLLLLILKKTKHIQDVIAFGMVCKSWNEAATNNNIKQYCPRRPDQIPLLALSAERKTGPTDIRQLCSLDKEKILNKNLYVPGVLFKKCVGLNYGWILTESIIGETNLVHPLSRSHIELPNQANFESLPGYYSRRGAALSRNPSESSDFVLMIVHRGDDFCLSYWRTGDKYWTKIENKGHVGIKCRFSDVIYYKNQFYAISFCGYVCTCKISGPRDPIVARRVTEIDPYTINSSHGPFIVEAGGALLVVIQEVTRLDEEETRIYSVPKYRVYKLDLVKGGLK